jgi:hypothetical protein
MAVPSTATQMSVFMGRRDCRPAMTDVGGNTDEGVNPPYAAVQPPSIESRAPVIERAASEVR